MCHWLSLSPSFVLLNECLLSTLATDNVVRLTMVGLVKDKLRTLVLSCNTLFSLDDSHAVV